MLECSLSNLVVVAVRMPFGCRLHRGGFWQYRIKNAEHSPLNLPQNPLELENTNCDVCRRQLLTLYSTMY